MAVDLAELAALVPLPDDTARSAARDVLRRLAEPDALGRLAEMAVWLVGVQQKCPPDPPQKTWLVAVGPEDVAQASGVTLLASSRHEIVLDLWPDAAPRPIVQPLGVPEPGAREGPPSRDQTERAFSTGVAAATDGIQEHRPDLVVVVVRGANAAVAAASLICVLTSTDVASVVGRGPGIDDREWIRRCAAARDLARAGRRTLADGGDILGLLEAIGSLEIATAVGLLLQAAISRLPVVLDGPVATAAALVAHRVTSRVARWMLAAHATPDPGHAAALKRLRLEPFLDYAISTDDGTGPLLIVPHLQASALLLAGNSAGHPH